MHKCGSIRELMEKHGVNPLMVVMSVRDFPISWYWIDKVRYLDKLIIKYHPHHEAHRVARKWFLDNPQYTHMLIYAEDVIATPCHIALLIHDYIEYGYPVISGYSNWEWMNDWVNITDRDMRKISVIMPQQYRFHRLKDLLKSMIDGKVEYPLKKVFFVGLPLTLIRRDVVEKVPFRPNRWVTDRTLGKFMRRGIMFDLQFAIDCANNNIPIYVDLRCLVLHFGDTRRLINIANKKPYVRFVRAGESICQ